MPLRKSVADIVGAVPATAFFSGAACTGGDSAGPVNVRIPNEITSASRFMVSRPFLAGDCPDETDRNHCLWTRRSGAVLTTRDFPIDLALFGHGRKRIYRCN